MSKSDPTLARRGRVGQRYFSAALMAALGWDAADPPSQGEGDHAKHGGGVRARIGRVRPMVPLHLLWSPFPFRLGSNGRFRPKLAVAPAKAGAAVGLRSDSGKGRRWPRLRGGDGQLEPQLPTPNPTSAKKRCPTCPGCASHHPGSFNMWTKATPARLEGVPEPTAAIRREPQIGSRARLNFTELWKDCAASTGDVQRQPQSTQSSPMSR